MAPAAPTTKYATWLFDCDGVILNSNKAKTDAFRIALGAYSASEVDQFIVHHTGNGGVSRYAKVDHFFERILCREARDGEKQMLLDTFAELSSRALHEVEEDVAFRSLTELIRGAGSKVFVVSGGDERELRDVFAQRRLDGYVDGIYGSPRTKQQIVRRLLEAHPDLLPAVFVGDGQLDLAVACDLDLDFIYVDHWAEWTPDPSALPSTARSISDLAQLLQELGATLG
jgi:phosphoglycolate phosphatase-like HAD superfamily hydrolase